MPRLQSRSFDTPDEVNELAGVKFEMVGLDDAVVGRCRFPAGWRWSTDFGPVLGLTTCPIRHIGYVISGTVRFEMDDGQAIEATPGSVFEVPPGHDKWVVGDEAWETIEWGGSGRAATEALRDTGTRALATVLFTDIVESTATVSRIGDAAWRNLLAAHDARLRLALNSFLGREVKTTGDGLLAVFENPTRAVRCAAEMIRVTRGGEVEIRVGVHTGEIERVGEDVRGIAVHVASRVLALAGANEVMVSSTTRDLVEGSGLALEDAGAFELKGLSGTRQVYRLTVPSA